MCVYVHEALKAPSDFMKPPLCGGFTNNTPSVGKQTKMCICVYVRVYEAPSVQGICKPLGTLRCCRSPLGLGTHIHTNISVFYCYLVTLEGSRAT